MDIEKEYSCLEQNKKVFQKCIDVDENYQETLQAYCDDLYRILKCTSHSYVTSVDINFNEIKVLGKTEICVTYYDESSNLCYADFDEEFTKSIEAENLTDSAFATAFACDKYCSFRVINQRRIDIHSSSTINVTVYDKQKCPCIISCEGSKLKKEKIMSADIVGANVNRLEFDKEIILNSLKIKRVISANGYALVDEVKIIKDKALIKTSVCLSLLYSVDGENEAVSRYGHTFSLSKIIDLNGIDENAMSIVNVDIGSLFFKLKSSPDDSNSVLQLYGELTINSLFAKEEEKAFVTDGYVLNYKSSCNYSSYPCICNGRYVNDEIQQAVSFDFNNEIKEVYDLNIKILDCYIKSNKPVIKINASIFCKTASGDLASFVTDTEACVENYDCKNGIACANIQSYDYNLLSGGKVNVRLTYLLSAYLYEEKMISVLSDICAEDDLIQFPALTVYFGKKDESVWNIAKSFSSDMDTIINENQLNSEFLEDNKVLIIPGV